ncbi:receptor kinase-like protein Xa21 [Telopea speciosissima]|uniref:receptor kinase-like protein Xa21 n=1 Tax=Telopea speciosissima TaxID=54955 RepID=UPI001CC5E2D8|nr:receptor kinase-like protein Xa21 [Telopea speciosissima]
MALHQLILVFNIFLFAGSSLRLLESVTPDGTNDRLALLEFKKQIIDDLLANCTRLREIHFSFNNLVRKIPVELFTSLSKLEIISINDNGLIGEIPASFGNISSLRVISLNGNELQGSIPESFGQLTNLNFLSLGQNKLSGMFPVSLHSLSSLEVISFYRNQLHGSLPPDIGLTLPNLIKLLLGINFFSGSIPNSISNFSKLEIVDLGDNNFIGPVPNNLGNLQNLQVFSIAGNQCGTGKSDDFDFLKSLVNCTHLRFLALQINCFKGPLPNFKANLSTQLSILHLGGNQISGIIPTGIENLINLTDLSLGENFLESNIPSVIGKLPKLQRLLLGGNRLSGQIPSSIGNLTFLYELHLEGNNLNASIPTSIGNCQRLQYLNLSHNNLQGPIPKQLFLISSLSISLDLSSNSLVSSLPIEIGNLKSLSTIDISNNKLSGEIPSSVGDCNSLEHLYMGGNLFEGTIPQSLTLLKGLQDLDLSHNNLSGQIPQDLEKLSVLQSLNLFINNLKGEVPTKGIFGNASAILVNGNDKLCGGIAELHMPTCKNHGSAEREKSKAFRIVLTIIGMYKGIIDQHETIVAVKVLNHQNPRVYKSFMAECKALRNIRHRNLVKILTSCSSLDLEGKDFKALVYEFMPNGSLDDWLHLPMQANNHSRSLGLLQRLNIAIDVAFALDYLHYDCYVPIVHCDLKPSNILFDNDMTAHISDFGLARLLVEPDDNSSQAQTSTIGIKGSIGYAAPEYGMGGKATIQGDIFSYGILLLEMFIGKRPTDQMFSDDLNLRNFAKAALPVHVMQIFDPILLPKEEHSEESEDEAINKTDGPSHRTNKLQDCMASIIEIALQCSMESPRERLNMKDVVRELRLIKGNFLEAL